jgi:hypothetical protein
MKAGVIAGDFCNTQERVTPAIRNRERRNPDTKADPGICAWTQSIRAISRTPGPRPYRRHRCGHVRVAVALIEPRKNIRKQKPVSEDPGAAARRSQVELRKMVDYSV